MKELNEKLATDVMMWKVHDLYPGWYWEQLSESSLEGRCRIEAWNPTTDLNQLRECYLAAEKDWGRYEYGEFQGEFEGRLRFLLECRFVGETESEYQRLVATAWVKHPELVAQAILKAKGVV